jgi:magnesium transporter
MQFELSTEYLDNLKLAIEQQDNVGITDQLNELFPEDIAEILNQLPFEDVRYVYALLSEDYAGEVLVELNEDVQEKLLASLTSKEIAEQIDNLNSDDAADIIADLPESVQDEVLQQIEDSEQASDIADLLSYDENSAGGLMAKELVSVNIHSNVGQVIEEVRRQAEKVDIVYAIYVIDEKEKLLGIIELKKLIVSAPYTSVEEIYNHDIISIKTNATSEEVAELMEKYDLVVLPVIDTLGRLVGRITIDDVVDVIREEAEKDIQLMSGISDDVELQDKVWVLSKARIPWLIIGMCGGIIGSRIIGGYEGELKIHPEMAFFIPLIGAMGGNVGVQSSAIIVQGLANNSVMSSNIWPKIFKELSVGLLNGFICSGLIFLYNLLVSDSFGLTLTVSIALITVTLFASFLGTFVPLTLHRFKLNPALATGPFVTTLNDILGITIYFLVGRMLYSVFT